MQIFHVSYTGDYLDADGSVAYGDIGLDILDNCAFVGYDFLHDQKPSKAEKGVWTSELKGPDPFFGSGYWNRLYSLEITPEHLAGADGIVVLRPWVKASAFAAGAKNLVVIGRAGAGYDKIDLEACTTNDVAVFNAPDTLTHSTATAALLFMLALAMRLPEQQRLARSGSWDRQASLMGDELTGQTLGIVGLGKTGMELVRLLTPFRMRVIAYSPRAIPEQAAKLGVTLVPTLADLLGQADFVSLHCRLEERTRGMIGETELRMMKPSAYFINVGRGELVDQEALVKCLRERRIAGAGLDVFEVEPLPVGDSLLELDNVILTPHWLPATRQAVRATAALMARGMVRAAQGRIPDNVINSAVLERPGFRAKLTRFEENRGKG